MTASDLSYRIAYTNPDGDRVFYKAMFLNERHAFEHAATMPFDFFREPEVVALPMAEDEFTIVEDV
jgi:hypothetical protein